MAILTEKSVGIAFLFIEMAKLWDCLPLEKQLELAEKFKLPVVVVETKWGKRCYLKGQVPVEEDTWEIEKIMRSNKPVYKKEFLERG